MIRRSFTKEFKVEACKMVTIQGQSVRETAKNLGLSAAVLCRWIRESKRPEAGIPFPEGVKEESRVRELEVEVKRLRLEREILKKAMAYFVEAPK
jgi:transposase